MGWTGARNGESHGVLVRIGNTLGGDMLFSGRKVNILHGGAIGGGVLRGVSKRLCSFLGISLIYFGRRGKSSNRGSVPGVSGVY